MTVFQNDYRKNHEKIKTNNKVIKDENRNKRR